MSWFEATAIASLAKSAIKEAQKTIDKALDIREEENITDPNTISPTVKKQLKEESDSFFANFGLSEKSKENIDPNDPQENQEESSQNEVRGGEEGNVSGGRMVGSLWGSFTGSFFENPKTATKENASCKSASAPSTPSELVVATQPPRSLSSLPESSKTSLLKEDSSNDSSIVQLGSEALSPRLESPDESPFLKEIECSDEPVAMNQDGVLSSKDVGWEWGWESSIMVMSNEAKLSEDSLPSKTESIPREESLADDTLDPDGFAKSRLIVGSVDSESSSYRHGSFSSVTSVRSQSDLDSLLPVPEEEVFAPDAPSLRISLLSEGRGTAAVEERPDLVLDSPDSIILLGSGLASPQDSSVGGADPLLRFQSPLESLGSPESIEVIGPVESPLSPSSIEVLSGTSSELPSPTSASNTLSDDASSTSFSKLSSASEDLNSSRPSDDSQEKAWRSSQEDAERQAITRQPISAKKIHPEEGAKAEGGAPGVETCSGGESFHSSTTSSSTLVMGNSYDEADRGVESAETPQTSEGQGERVKEDLAVSMNAGEIRKNLGKVDKDPEARKSIGDEALIGKEESSSAENSSTAILEMSSRSESSTETVTASMDSQHMAWSDIAPIDFPQEDSTKLPGGEEEVQDMLEEAMGEEQQQQQQQEEEGDPDAREEPDPELAFVEGEEDRHVESVGRELSPSSSDRSDPLKVCSSGHSSADEVETATSSDIEVISSPSIDGSSNGTSRCSHGLPPSVASKVWMTAQRGLRTFINDKADGATLPGANGKRDGNGYQGETVPSSMTTSFTSISESDGDSPHLPHSELLQLEASRITQALLQDINAREKGHRRNQSNLSETSESSSEPHSPEVERLNRKMNQLKDILESRETKVLELSHLNASLQDANTSLKSRLEELEGLRKGNESTECLREEFTQRLVTMERKFQQALREKENTKKQLEEFRVEAASRRSHADIKREMEDKDTVISELRKEGEKLSKQQLNYSTVVKKLRAKEKEAEAAIKDQSEKIDDLSSELDRLRKQLRAKEEVERRQIDAIRQLTVSSQRLEEDVKRLKAENAEGEGKLDTLKQALDSAYKEMNELQRSALTKDAEAQKMALSAEVSARQKVETALTEAQEQSRMEKGALRAQIHELQDTLSQVEAQGNRKERQLKSEVEVLLQRLSEAESRSDDLSNSVSAATRPLLRQMENLQASQVAQQATWESMEESLTKRLNEAQKNANASAKKEREAKEQLSSTMTEISSIQSQVSSLQADNAQLRVKLEVLTLKNASLEEAKARETVQLEALKSSFAEEISDVKHERDLLEQQLEIERTAVTAEKRKSLSLQDHLRDKERKIAQLAAPPSTESRISTPRSSPTPSLSRLSVSGSVAESLAGSQWRDDVFDSSWGPHWNTSLYDTMRGNNAATVDALTSTLRQREGEVYHLQSELSRLETQKESLALELVQSSRRVEESFAKVKEMEEVKATKEDMEQKYNALLQMYGEKVEEVEELRLDLEDVKEMYKLQIDQLMQK